tara:strand:+ start:648 stop:2609 length:1962 start_codon:yes stop_codon:yes gene_type:complete
MCDKVNLLTKDIDKKILKEINSITDGFLKKNNLIKSKLISEYESSLKTGYQSIISKKVLYYYKYVREEREKYGKYYVIDELGISRVILDCEKLSDGNEFWKLVDLEFSNDESFLVFSVDTKGSGLCDIYLKSYFEDTINLLVNNNEDKISGNLQISYNNKKIYYTTCDKDIRKNKLYCYEIKSKTNNLLYKEDSRQFNISLGNSCDNSKIFMIVHSYSSNEIYEILDDRLMLLFERSDYVEYSVDYYINTWYVLKKNKDKTTDFLKYDDECFEEDVIIKNKNIEIDDYYIAYGYAFIFVIENGNNTLYLLSLSNNKVITTRFIDSRYRISFPRLSNMNVLNSVVVISFESYIIPMCNIVIDLKNLEDKLFILDKKYYQYKYEKINYDERRYRIDTLEVNNKGLRISMIYNKEIKGKCRKCLLYGYGSYGIKMEPYFSKYIPSLLDRGYYYCIAHIRGGSENGLKWYHYGKLLNKKNTFKDYIECADYLTMNGYTDSSKLVGMGESAGGLLMGAVINMRPELFNLVVMGVPFVNVMSEMCNDKKALTTEEYLEWGNPKIKKYFDYMKSYCPYSNINLKNNYPNIYLYSNINDSLVDYKVPYNYYMKIREADVFKNKLRKIFLNIKLKYGHKGSSNHFEKNDEISDVYSIILSIN